MSGAIRPGKARGPKPRGIRPGKGPIAKGAHGQDSYFIFVINKYKKCKVISQLLALSEGGHGKGPKAKGHTPRQGTHSQRGPRPGKGPIAKKGSTAPNLILSLWYINIKIKKIKNIHKSSYSALSFE